MFPRPAGQSEWAASKGTEVWVDGKGAESRQSDAQTVSDAGGRHRKLPVSVFSLHADKVESVDVSSSTQKTLIEDDNKHHPGIGQELEADRQQE